MRRLAVTLAALALVGVASTACSDSSPSAEEKVCDARTQVQSTYDSIKDDATSLNFGEAKDQLPALRAAFSDLLTAEQELGQDKRDAIQPDLDAAKSSVESITDATSLKEITSALGSARSSLQKALSTVATTADCS